MGFFGFASKSAFSVRSRAQSSPGNLGIFVVTGMIVTIAATGFAQTQIQARRADQFVDSIGINVHMESPNPPYSQYAKVNLELQSLGMRHVRDEINDTDQSFVKEMEKIGELGYTLCGLIEGGNDYPPHGHRLGASEVIPMIQSLQPAIDAVEGPNEPDDGWPKHDTFIYDRVPYPKGAINESVDLSNIVKGVSEISSLPILAMSEGNAEDFNLLAKLVKLGEIPPPADYTTYGNMHAYQGGGVGDNGLDRYIQLSEDWTGSESIWTTEMGYHNNISYLTDGEQQGVSERASAIYLPIAFLSGFKKGVMRTFSYELMDEAKGPPPKCSGELACSGEGYYGLLQYDFKPKPAFTAMKNLIALLQDAGSNFEPGSLSITFSGAPNTLRYTLLQKSNGAYYLALWNDVSVYKLAAQTTSGKVVPGKDVYPANVPLTVTFSAPKTFTVYAPNDATGVNPTGIYTISETPRSLDLDLPAEVLLLEIQ